MTKQRRRQQMEAAAAAQRLILVARGPGSRGAGPGGQSGRSADDDDFGWFDQHGGPQARRGPDPGSGALGGGGAAGGGAAPVGARWREFAADRVPIAFRGASAVPVAGAVAVLLVVAAVVIGVGLRARATEPEIVDLAPGSRASAQAAAAGGPGSASAGTTGVGSPGAGSSPAGPGAVVGAAAARVPSAGPSISAPSISAPVTAAPVASAPVVVDVVGRVRRPGLVRLPPGSRVADAVAAAGGATDAAALPRINLARLLVDGEQVVVPDADDPLPAPPAAAGPGGPGGPGGSGGGPSGTARPAGPLDLNTATAADLDELPGVGPVLAGRIVEWRAQHQRFTRVDELAEVAGIGDKVLERLRPLVTV